MLTNQYIKKKCCIYIIKYQNSVKNSYEIAT